MERSPDSRRFRAVIEYDGTEFHGWQIQKNGRSVQGVMEAAAEELFGMPVRVHGAGRTDAGVHASGQVAHFDAQTTLDPSTIRRALNARLSDDVTIRDLDHVPSDFHARYSASSRLYAYTIVHDRVSLGRNGCWMLYGNFDHDRTIDAAACLLGTHDFTSFSKDAADKNHGFCHVFDAAWKPSGSRTTFTIRANRFLTGMVRALVGGLTHVGRGRLPVEGFKELLEARDPRVIPPLAPARGLVLSEVRYDPEEYSLVADIMAGLRETPNPGDATLSVKSG